MHYYQSKPETWCGMPFKPVEMINERDGVSYGAYTYTIERFDSDITTYEFEKVDCPSCLEALKKTTYHCEEHGFLSCWQITEKETCKKCGLPVGEKMVNDVYRKAALSMFPF